MVTTPTIITLFPTITTIDKPEHCALLEVLESIKSKSNPFKHVIKEINTVPHDMANNLKLSLPPICFSGKFSKRDDSGLIQYSQLICIDVDEVADIRGLKTEVKDIPFVYSSFISPSGKGLKLLVFHDCTDSTRHGDIYRFIGKKLGLTTRTDLKFDMHCSNLSRACFFSYDPALVINKNAIPLNIDLAKLKSSSISTTKFSSHDTLSPVTLNPLPGNYTKLKQYKESIVKEIEEFERFHSFYPGVRNRNLNILVCKLRSKGYPEEVVSPYLQLYYGGRHPDFTAAEIKSCISSVYRFCP